MRFRCPIATLTARPRRHLMPSLAKR